MSPLESDPDLKISKGRARLRALFVTFFFLAGGLHSWWTIMGRYGVWKRDFHHHHSSTAKTNLWHIFRFVWSKKLMPDYRTAIGAIRDEAQWPDEWSVAGNTLVFLFRLLSSLDNSMSLRKQDCSDFAFIWRVFLPPVVQRNYDGIHIKICC